MTNEDLETVKREAMIEMADSICKALIVRVGKWFNEAKKFPPRKIIINPRQAKRDAQNLAECRIRMDEIQKIRQLIMDGVSQAKETDEEKRATGQALLSGA